MIYDAKKDHFVMSTGREFYANRGILGLREDDPEPGEAPWQDGKPRIRSTEFFEGYDGTEYADDFTPEERKEMADYMIALWTAWGASKP